MNFISTIRNIFRRSEPPSAPKLRNKPGGMAWILGIDHGNGIESINGAAVRCVCIQGGAIWRIDPKIRVTFTRDTLYQRQDLLVRAGESYFIDGIADANLDPWKDDGVTDEEVRDLYSPVPTKEHA